jgi:hypothetical protein
VAVAIIAKEIKNMAIVKIGCVVNESVGKIRLHKSLLKMGKSSTYFLSVKFRRVLKKRTGFLAGSKLESKTLLLKFNRIQITMEQALHPT